MLQQVLPITDDNNNRLETIYSIGKMRRKKTYANKRACVGTLMRAKLRVALRDETYFKDGNIYVNDAIT